MSLWPAVYTVSAVRCLHQKAVYTVAPRMWRLKLPFSTAVVLALCCRTLRLQDISDDRKTHLLLHKTRSEYLWLFCHGFGSTSSEKQVRPPSQAFSRSTDGILIL